MLMQLRSERRIMRWIWTLVVLAGVYAWMSFSLVGGETFFDYHSSALPFVLSLVVVGQLLRLWRETDVPDQRRVWGMWLLAASLWAVAEGIWFVADAVLRLSFESTLWPANILWLVAYPFFLWGLFAQLRMYRVKLPEAQWRRLRYVFVTIGVVVALLVAGPILAQFSWEELRDNWVNALYVVFDGVLLGLLLVLFTVLQRGYAREGWALIGLGFGLIALADILIFHLDWYDLYYPNDAYTRLSIFADYVYVMGYAVWAVGLYAYRVLQSAVRQAPALQLEEQHEVALWPRHRIMLFSDDQGRLIDASPGMEVFRRAVDTPAEEGSEPGAPRLDEVLPPSVVANLEQRLRDKNESFIPGLPLVLTTVDGREVSVRLYAQAVRYGDAWRGMNILLLCFEPLGVDDGLSEEQRRLADYMLERAGERDRLVRTSLRAYLGEVLNAFYQEALAWLGVLLAQRYLREVVTAARRQGWNLRLEENQARVSYPDNLDAEQMVQMARTVLRAAWEHGQSLVGREAMETAWRAAWSRLSEDVQHFVSQQGLHPDTWLG